MFLEDNNHMSQKKSAKQFVKRGTKKTEPNLLKTSQAIFQAPHKLINEVEKTLKMLSNKDIKLKKATEAANKLTNKIEKKLNGPKANHLSKKEFNNLTKKAQEVTQLNKSLEKSLKENQHSFNEHKQLNTKLIAFSKHLSQFEKEWEKSANKSAKNKIAASPSAKQKISALILENDDEAFSPPALETSLTNKPIEAEKEISTKAIS